MTEELKTKITAWVKKEQSSYIEECGYREYKSYMADDAKYTFAPGDPQLQEQVFDLVYQILNDKIKSE